MIRKTLGLALFTLILSATPAGFSLREACAGSAVSIAPTRIIFNGSDRVATIYLSNKGDEAATYRISLSNKRMLETGQIVPADSTLHGERFAMDMLRFSPRRVVIPAHGSQTVRVMLRSPRGGTLENGEYRSHLTFQSVPDVPTVEDIENEPGDLRVRAVAIIEMSIPVIVRRGNPQAEIRFGTIELNETPDNQGRPILLVPLERTGERSVYGDLNIHYIADDGKTEHLAILGGLGVYYPTPVRNLRVPLEIPDGMKLSGGKLRVSYVEVEEGGGDLAIAAELPIAPRVAAD